MYNLNSLYDDSDWRRGSPDLREQDDLLETYAAAIERAVSVFLCVCVCDCLCLCVYVYIYI